MSLELIAIIKTNLWSTLFSSGYTSSPYLSKEASMTEGSSVTIFPSSSSIKGSL